MPQAICQRFGLAVGYKMRWLVWLLLWVRCSGCCRTPRERRLLTRIAQVACPVGIPVAKVRELLRNARRTSRTR